MKFNIFKYFVPAAAALALAFGATSCADDLNQSSIDPQTRPAAEQQGYYAKIYGLMTLSGQRGIADIPDISDDPGKNPFFRRVWEAQEFPTDECLWVWQNDAGQPEFVNFTWSSDHIFTKMLYNRLAYNITQCNLFLDLFSGNTDAESQRQCAETRFFRAMYYQYFLDMFGRAPFKEHFDTENLPTEKVGQDLFAYIESEYKDILGEGEGSSESVLDAPQPNAATFGRVNKAAVWMMLARLYLNAEAYTGTAHWQEAYDYADKVIRESGYKLCTADKTATVDGRDTTYTAYQQLFMGDNDQNANAMNEIILPIRQDGLRTRSYGGTYCIISSCYGSNMPNFYGTNDAWTCIRARSAAVGMFFNDLSAVPLTENPIDITTAAGDDRALFYGGAADGTQRTVQTETINKFQSGLSIVKFTNKHSDGTKNYNDPNIPDTDVPFIRLAEAYLTRAEANWRKGGDASLTLADVNALRSRAHASAWNANDLTETNFIKEWGREFYLEGRRRTDLVRFGAFTSSKYLWDWKGGAENGTAVRSTYNVFPVPSTELSNNPNMHQNAGY